MSFPTLRSCWGATINWRALRIHHEAWRQQKLLPDFRYKILFRQRRPFVVTWLWPGSKVRLHGRQILVLDQAQQMSHGVELGSLTVNACPDTSVSRLTLDARPLRGLQKIVEIHKAGAVVRDAPWASCTTIVFRLVHDLLPEMGSSNEQDSCDQLCQATGDGRLRLARGEPIRVSVREKASSVLIDCRSLLRLTQITRLFAPCGFCITS